MSWSKNVFSYIMWFIYAILVGSGLFCVLAYIGKASGHSLVAATFMGIATLVIACAFVVLVRFVGVKLILAEKFNFELPSGAKKFIFVVVSLIAVIQRVLAAETIYDPYQYFEQAKVVANYSMPRLTTGIEQLYVNFLHCLCIVMGNNMSTCIVVQVLLQFIALFVVYRLINKLFGFIPAILAFASFCLPNSIAQETVIFSPRVLFFFLFVIILNLTIKSIVSEAKYPILAGISAFLIGILAYHNILGFALLAVYFSVWLKKDESEYTIQQTTVFSIIGGICSLLGFLFGIFVNSLFYKNTFSDVLQSWGSLYKPNGFQIPEMLITMHNGEYILPSILLLSIGIFGFFCAKQNENISIWMLLVIVICFFSLFSFTTKEMTGFDLVYLCMSILAGLGIHSVFHFDVYGILNEQAEPRPESLPFDAPPALVVTKEEVEEESNSFDEVVIAGPKKESILKEFRLFRRRKRDQMAATFDTIDISSINTSLFDSIPTDSSKSRMTHSRTYETKIMEDARKKNMPKETVQTINSQSLNQENKNNEIPVKTEDENKPKIDFIENPLPLPKKHEHKTMDFDYEISEDDDFDF